VLYEAPHNVALIFYTILLLSVRNVDKHLPVTTAQYSKRLQSSRTNRVVP